MEPIRFFDSLQHLEPQCPGCKEKIDYGVTTEWSDKAESHVCKSCGQSV
jgi:hypothetical protein